MASPVRAVPDLREIELQTHHEINRCRRQHGLKELDWDDRIAEAARQHSQNMAERQFFDHYDPVHGDLRARLAQNGLTDWEKYGENLFMGSLWDDIARTAARAWLNSPGHRRNLLYPLFSRTGIGIAVNKYGNLYVIQIFY